MLSYRLSKNAQENLKKIQVYSVEQLGTKQAKSYLRKIRKHLLLISENPNIGKHRPDIKETYFSTIVGSHVIYYKVQPKWIEVIDILHQKMDPFLHML